MLLLKRLRTRLSIPLGLRHDEGTHLKRSDWWRQKRCLPVAVVSPPSVSRCVFRLCSTGSSSLSLFVSIFVSFPRRVHCIHFFQFQGELV